MSQSRINSILRNKFENSPVVDIPEILDAIQVGIIKSTDLTFNFNVRHFIQILKAKATNQAISQIDKEQLLENEKLLTISRFSAISNLTEAWGSLLKIIQDILTNKPLSQHTLACIMEIMHVENDIAHHVLFVVLSRELLTLNMLNETRAYTLRAPGYTNLSKDLSAYHAFLQRYEPDKAIYNRPLSTKNLSEESESKKTYVWTSVVTHLFHDAVDRIVADALAYKNLDSLKCLYRSGLVDGLDALAKQRILNACLDSTELKQSSFSDRCEFIARYAMDQKSYSVHDQIYFLSTSALNAIKNTDWVANYIEHFALQAMSVADLNEAGNIFSYFNNKHNTKPFYETTLYKLVELTHTVSNPLARFFPKSLLAFETNFTAFTERTSWKNFIAKLTIAYHERLNILVSENEIHTANNQLDNFECDFSVLNQTTKHPELRARIRKF